MKVIIDGGVAIFSRGLSFGPLTTDEVPITILGGDSHEEVPAGCVHIVHPDVTLEIGVEDLARALRPFLKRNDFS